jgi:hypothetical protein
MKLVNTLEHTCRGMNVTSTFFDSKGISFPEAGRYVNWATLSKGAGREQWKAGFVKGLNRVFFQTIKMSTRKGKRDTGQKGY